MYADSKRRNTKPAIMANTPVTWSAAGSEAPRRFGLGARVRPEPCFNTGARRKSKAPSPLRSAGALQNLNAEALTTYRAGSPPGRAGCPRHPSDCITADHLVNRRAFAPVVMVAGFFIRLLLLDQLRQRRRISAGVVAGVTRIHRGDRVAGLRQRRGAVSGLATPI